MKLVVMQHREIPLSLVRRETSVIVTNGDEDPQWVISSQLRGHGGLPSPLQCACGLGNYKSCPDLSRMIFYKTKHATRTVVYN